MCRAEFVRTVQKIFSQICSLFSKNKMNLMGKHSLFPQDLSTTLQTRFQHQLPKEENQDWECVRDQLAAAILGWLSTLCFFSPLETLKPTSSVHFSWWEIELLVFSVLHVHYRNDERRLESQLRGTTACGGDDESEQLRGNEWWAWS